jgi:excisionase family DNA binding protein
MSEGWGKVRAAAEYAGMSQRTVRDWLKMGLPHSKVRGSILIEYRQLDEWLRGFAVVMNLLDGIVDEVLRDF